MVFDYLVVGAGFAGSVCAERLAHAGRRVLIVEQRDHIGGNAYDRYDAHGILVSVYGAHCFHTNSRNVFDYLSRFTSWRPYVHRVLSSVNGQLVPVPINLTTLEAFGGDEAAARAAIVEPYTRKQWGLEPSALAPQVLARIKTRANRDDRYFADIYQAMPAHGYTRLFERLLAHENIHLLLQTRYQDVRAVIPHKALIYTGPIDEYFDHCCGALPYRSARFTFETHETERMQPVAVINYPGAHVPYTRVAEFKHLTGQRHHSTTLAYEFPQATGDPYWPIPTAHTAALAEQYRALAASTSNIWFCGRLGSYLYVNMDQAVAQALALTARLLSA